jgi:hypothetical protein
MTLPQTAKVSVELEALAASLYGELSRLQGNELQESAVQKILEPFVDELKLFQQQGKPLEARQLCMGLLLGLYRFDTQVASHRASWPSGALNNLAEAMVFEWKNGGPSKDDMAAVIVFIEENLGEWGKRLV